MTYERFIRPDRLLQLEQHWLEQEPLKGTHNERDFKPCVKLFTPMGGATWLLSEKEPATDIAFGLCDLGMGCPELGEVSLNELFAARGPAGVMLVEEDLYFSADKTLSQYADEARQLGRINA